MAEREKGGIIFVSSMMAFQGVPHFSAYAATNAHKLLLAEGLHFEFKKSGVDVLALCPGLTDTEMIKTLDVDKFPLKPMKVEPVVKEAISSIGNRMYVVPGTMTRIINIMGKRIMSRTMNSAIFGKLFEKLL